MTEGEKNIWDTLVDCIVVSPIGASLIEMLGDFIMEEDSNDDKIGVQKIGKLYDKNVYLDPYMVEDKVVLNLKEHRLNRIDDTVIKAMNVVRCYNCKRIVEYSDEDVKDSPFVVCPDCKTEICILE